MPRRCSFKIELDFPQPLAGVDEAGCAPLAGPVVAAGALWVGSTRLIDNVLCTPPA